MSKEKLLKIWKVTKTIIIPLTIALSEQPGSYWVLHLC